VFRGGIAFERANDQLAGFGGTNPGLNDGQEIFSE
jgi:hypothetical protein